MTKPKIPGKRLPRGPRKPRNAAVERARSSIVDRELRTFTEKERKFIDAIDMGMHVTQAAAHAGYAFPGHVAHALLDRPAVREELQRRLTKNRQFLEMTKEKAQAMVMRAYEIAELQADAGSMVRAASEINRMCGFYATVERKVQLDVTVIQHQEELKTLSDAELIRMAGQRVGQVLEGKAIKVIEHEVAAIIAEDRLEDADDAEND